jgi:predicted nucleic acid-binding protein
LPAHLRALHWKRFLERFHNPNSEDENTGRCILQANFCAVQIVEQRETPRVTTEDPDESRVHECALEGRADVIVSSDRYVLKLVRYQVMSIFTVREFMESTALHQPKKRSLYGRAARVA